MTLSNWQLFLRIAVTITLYTNCNLIFNPCNFISPNCDFISQNYYTFYYFSEMWSYFTCKFFFLFWSHNYMFIFVLIKSLKSRKVHKLILDSISSVFVLEITYHYKILHEMGISHLVRREVWSELQSRWEALGLRKSRGRPANCWCQPQHTVYFQHLTQEF